MNAARAARRRPMIDDRGSQRLAPDSHCHPTDPASDHQSYRVPDNPRVLQFDDRREAGLDRKRQAVVPTAHVADSTRRDCQSSATT